MPEEAFLVHEFVIRGGTVLTPEGLVRTAVGIDGERVAALGDRLSGHDTIEADRLWVLPGVIDGHTHMQAPAFGIESRDTFTAGTQAAAAGGVTTIGDFTVGSTGTSLEDQIRARLDVARTVTTDFALHAEIVGWRPDRAGELGAAVRMGVRSFKFYMVYAERSDHGQLLDAFRAIASLDGVAMVHAEDEEILRAATQAVPAAERGRMASFPRSRPPESESAAVELACHLAEVTRVRLHLAHLSTAAALESVRRAKARGVRVTAETCPQYLLLDERAYAGAEGRQFSVVPPLRTQADREALWVGLGNGTLDAVASDHCPFARADKEQGTDVLEIPCGLPGVETLLPLVHAEGVVKRRLRPERLASLLSARPAEILNLAQRKGAIAVGADADLVLFDPKKAWTVGTQSLHLSTDFSPYEGFAARGAVVRTFVRGRTVFQDGEFAGRPQGRFVPQEPARGLCRA